MRSLRTFFTFLTCRRQRVLSIESHIVDKKKKKHESVTSTKSAADFRHLSRSASCSSDSLGLKSVAFTQRLDVFFVCSATYCAAFDCWASFFHHSLHLFIQMCAKSALAAKFHSRCNFAAMRNWEPTYCNSAKFSFSREWKKVLCLEFRLLNQHNLHLSPYTRKNMHEARFCASFSSLCPSAYTYCTHSSLSSLECMAHNICTHTQQRRTFLSLCPLDTDRASVRISHSRNEEVVMEETEREFHSIHR